MLKPCLSFQSVFPSGNREVGNTLEEAWANLVDYCYMEEYFSVAALLIIVLSYSPGLDKATLSLNLNTISTALFTILILTTPHHTVIGVEEIVHALHSSPPLKITLNIVPILAVISKVVAGAILLLPSLPYWIYH